MASSPADSLTGACVWRVAVPAIATSPPTMHTVGPRPLVKPSLAGRNAASAVTAAACRSRSYDRRTVILTVSLSRVWPSEVAVTLRVTLEPAGADDLTVTMARMAKLAPGARSGVW